MGKKHPSCFFQRFHRDFHFYEKLSDFLLTLLLKWLFLMLKMLNVSYSTDTFIRSSPLRPCYYAYEVNEFLRLLFMCEHSTFVLNAEYMWWAEWDIFQLRVGGGGSLHSLAPTAAQLFLHVTPGYSGWSAGHVPFSCCSKTQHVSSHSLPVMVPMRITLGPPVWNFSHHYTVTINSL